ncbi:NAD-dependent epimerase/dehydratase family protein [Marinobacter daepoensis]|uniref:NAD-dependent epimerase/dehydratase family protein n=1 Tax=Marinobacter daepoensis TaxID=262077 RepID=UPI000406AEE6|nr:NAD-dependent epimerase/dehydratase family protein [Marinobacter daepoensis]
MTKTVAVTGASGFVGSEVCRLLRVTGVDVRGFFGRRSVASEPGELSLDLLAARKQWEAALRDVDVVVHLAALTHDRVGEGGYEEIYAVNVKGTENLVQAAVSAGVKRFVFMSSIKVNGEHTPEGSAFRVSDAPRPSSDYGSTKLEAERRVSRICQDSGVDWVVVRAPLVCGPGVKGNLADLARWIVRGWPLPLGAIENKRSMVSVADLSDLLCKCVFAKDNLATVLLAADDSVVSTSDICRWMFSEVKSSSWLLPVPAFLLSLLFRLAGRSELRAKLLGSLVVDNTVAKQKLAWCPEKGVEQAVRAMASEVQSSMEKK